LSRLEGQNKNKTAQRIGVWHTYKNAFTCYCNKIMKDKRSSWRGYCHGIIGVASSARLIRVMAKQVTNRVGTIKLPDGHYTWTGRDTLKELSRVHFPDSRITDDSGDVEGQPNLDAHR
jgi:hypothetical protein